MSRLSLAAILAILMTMFTSAAFAETGTGTVSNPPVVTTSAPLLLDTVIATDAKSITLTFNQSIRVDSIRVRIIDQASNESIKVSSITGSTTNTSMATIVTASTLTAGASYVLTITSALSDTDMTIKAGIDSIREFTAPLSLSGAVLSAPPNPSAVIVATGATATGSTGTTTTVVPKPTVATGVILVPVDTGALPATGAPTVILIILAGLSAFGLLLLRKKA